MFTYILCGSPILVEMEIKYPYFHGWPQKYKSPLRIPGFRNLISIVSILPMINNSHGNMICMWSLFHFCTIKVSMICYSYYSLYYKSMYECIEIINSSIMWFLIVNKSYAFINNLTSTVIMKMNIFMQCVCGLLNIICPMNI